MSKFKLPVGGPGIIIAAAFIGPGTVTICTLAGAGHGLQLLWAVLLSTILTIFFQEMASRLGIITQLDLTGLIKRELKHPSLRIITLGIVLSAIVIGNAAYEAGNISGGALGFDAILFLKFNGFNFSPLLIGGLAFVILWLASQKLLTTSLTLLVALMSLSFVLSAVLIQPDIGSLLSGLFVPKIPEGSLILVLGVVGTTVVPYNLFLHASLAKIRWVNPEDIKKAKRDTILAVTVGGLVSMAIVICASALQGQPINNALDMAKSLTPVFGLEAKYFITIGLFAAGITSAITAPLAAAFVLTAGFGWNTDLTSKPFRMTWMSILGIGVLFSSIGYRPIEVIRFAQVTNGLILPIIAVLLIWLCSKTKVLGAFRNRFFTTSIGILAIVLLTLLGIKSIWMVLH